ncbi:MAG: RNA-binding protein, partial [Bacteroidota bacterium]
IDPVLCFYHQGGYYPYAGRDDLMSQLPHLKKKFSRYVTYANATIEDIFPAAQLASAAKLEAAYLANTVWMQEDGKFKSQSFENSAQTAPVYAVLTDDFNGDQQTDILMVGNYSGNHPETGVYDAGNGVLLTSNGGQFNFMANRIHGLWASQEARDLASIKLAGGGAGIIVANNNGTVQLFAK